MAAKKGVSQTTNISLFLYHMKLLKKAQDYLFPNMTKSWYHEFSFTFPLLWVISLKLRMHFNHVFLLMQLGAKKGLGAQKVSNKSFSEVEKQAQVAEKLREEQAVEAQKQAEESM